MLDNHDLREDQLYRKARRKGLSLQKNRCKDPKVPSYGGYLLIDPTRDIVVVGDSPFPYCADLDEIENYLAGWNCRQPN